MRTLGFKTIAVAAVAAAFVVSGTAQAAPCAPIPTSYDTGGAPRSAFPNDPLFANQWGLTQIKAPEAWARGAMGSGATIAVVDSGADLNHPDLAGKLAPGVDLVSGETCTPGAQDLNGHGTHVAGIAAAATHNGIGVAGTAPLAQVMPVRVLDADGAGTDADVVAGIRYAVAHGAQVINLSLGSEIGICPACVGLPVDLSDTAAAMEEAHNAGVTVVAAAGNSSYPLCSNAFTAEHAICVAANDETGFPSFYSNFPAVPSGVALRAPGGSALGACDDDIWSTYWPAASGDWKEVCGPRGYEAIAGTSMAAPFVSGVAAMLRAAGLSNQQTIDCLKQNSSNGGAYDPIFGYGNLNADAAVAACTQLPVGGGQTPTGGTNGTSTGPGGGQTTPGPGDQGGVQGESTASDATPPRLRLAIPRSRKLHAARSGFITVRVRLNESSKILVSIYSGRQTQIAGRNSVMVAAKLTRRRAGTHSVRVALTKAGRRILRQRRVLTVTVMGIARDASGNDGTAIAEGKIRR